MVKKRKIFNVELCDEEKDKKDIKLIGKKRKISESELGDKEEDKDKDEDKDK